MHARHEFESLRNPYPARQDSDVRNETDVAHEPVALFPGVSVQDPQISLIRNQAKYRIQRGSLPRAVWADDPEDAPFLNPEINPVKRDRGAERLSQAPCFNACHLNQCSSFLSDLSSDLFAGFGAPGPLPFSNSSACSPRRWMVASILGHSSARNFCRSPFSR